MLKSNLQGNKRWNLFTGDTSFKTDNFLKFMKKSCENKFQREMFIRLKYTFVNFIIMVAAVFTYLTLLHTIHISDII